MDAERIFVLVLTLVSFGLLVAMELNSRRNTKRLKEEAEQRKLQTPPVTQ